ncbi:MAG: phytoene/squalene synthase family protein [Bacteroidota bacterium]
MSLELFSTTTFKCSKLITEHYSTSFTLGIKTLDKSLHFPIYAIYGFVRYADEIVDTFHEYDKKYLLEKFKKDTYEAIETGISLNPVIHSFQETVNRYNVGLDLIEAFLHSMEMDLYNEDYNEETYNEYIYGSAEVVGLMCLHVFCNGDLDEYNRLKEPARRLGAAFQKVNFIRDIKSDFKERGRVYFPGVDFDSFSKSDKELIEKDIQEDFDAAYQGILQLPKGARLGVYIAYIYYQKLFKKITKLPASKVLSERIRIPDTRKLAILTKTYFMHRLNFM